MLVINHWFDLYLMPEVTVAVILRRKKITKLFPPPHTHCAVSSMRPLDEAFYVASPPGHLLIHSIATSQRQPIGYVCAMAVYQCNICWHPAIAIPFAHKPYCIGMLPWSDNCPYCYCGWQTSKPEHPITYKLHHMM